MRKLFVFAMIAGLVGLGGFVRDARAGATVDLLIVGVNGAPVTATTAVSVNVGDTVTTALIMTNDQSLTAAVFSISYDLAGEHLDVVSAIDWTGVAIVKTGADTFAPLTTITILSNTFVGAFQGVTNNLSLPRTLPPSGGSFAGGYQMGTVVWKATALGSSVLTGGIINAALDGLGDAGFNDIGALLNPGSSTINVIPEPGTASLLGLGLVGLVLMGRRSRS